MSRRLAWLFLLALAGVAVALALTSYRLGGVPALLAVVGTVAVLLWLGLTNARAIVRARQRRAAGRTCTCCTTSQHDPVQVI